MKWAPLLHRGQAACWKSQRIQLESQKGGDGGKAGGVGPSGGEGAERVDRSPSAMCLVPRPTEPEGKPVQKAEGSWGHLKAGEGVPGTWLALGFH